MTQAAQPAPFYIIACVRSSCPCYQNGGPCQRGFFSLFLSALRGIEKACGEGMIPVVDFSNRRYLYSDPEACGGNGNFWNYYFSPPAAMPGVADKTEKRFATHEEVYPRRDWRLRQLRQLHDLAARFVRLRPEVEYLLGQRTRELLGSARVTGFHVRRTDIIEEFQPLPAEDYWGLMEWELEKDNRVFLSTDDESFVQEAVQRFGAANILVNSAHRSSGTMAIHKNEAIESRRALGIEALLDCHCLAACDRAYLTHSNLSYAALILNPDLPYSLLPPLRAHRWWRDAPPLLAVRWRRFRKSLARSLQP